jgi:hypothetical protein
VLQDTSVETQGTIDRARAFAAEGNNRAALELLMDVTVPSLRSEMNARLSRQRSMTPSGDAASALAGMVALIGLIFSPVALLLVFAITVAHIGDPRLWTAGVGGLMALAFGVAALAAGTAGLLEKRPRSGVLWAVVGGALVALGVVGLVSAFT